MWMQLAQVITVLLAMAGGYWKLDEKYDHKIEKLDEKYDHKIEKLDEKIENNRKESDQKWVGTIQKDMNKEEKK